MVASSITQKEDEFTQRQTNNLNTNVTNYTKYTNYHKKRHSLSSHTTNGYQNDLIIFVELEENTSDDSILLLNFRTKLDSQLEDHTKIQEANCHYSLQDIKAVNDKLYIIYTRISMGISGGVGECSSMSQYGSVNGCRGFGNTMYSNVLLVKIEAITYFFEFPAEVTVLMNHNCRQIYALKKPETSDVTHLDISQALIDNSPYPIINL